MRYFKRLWTEPRGDWGASWRYFEVDDTARVVRQIEAYDNRTVLKYGPRHRRDEYGKLSDEFNRQDAIAYEIGKVEFERRWANQTTAVFP
jgi:hypothetical protein